MRNIAFCVWVAVKFAPTNATTKLTESREKKIETFIINKHRLYHTVYRTNSSLRASNWRQWHLFYSLVADVDAEPWLWERKNDPLGSFVCLSQNHCAAVLVCQTKLSTSIPRTPLPSYLFLSLSLPLSLLLPPLKCRTHISTVIFCSFFLYFCLLNDLITTDQCNASVSI